MVVRFSEDFNPKDKVTICLSQDALNIRIGVKTNNLFSHIEFFRYIITLTNNQKH